MSDFESAALSLPNAASSFADDVRAGLTATHKTLPPKYLYDPLGSALFEAITQLPEYGVWRAERALLEDHAEEIAQGAQAASIVELGSGSATKTAPLLKALLRRQPISYWAVDLSAAAIAATRASLAPLRGLSTHSIESEYLPGLEIAMRTRAVDGHALVLFLGSSLGNFDHLASLRFLQRIRAALRPGDHLLLGADLQKPQTRLLAAYDDALGVTAAFNLNLLVRMNRELGADFALPQFRHRARFNAKKSDVEMHIESLSDQQVRFPGYSVSFESGETIHTESSHKYCLEELNVLAGHSGFAPKAQWLNEDWRFASTLYTAL